MNTVSTNDETVAVSKKQLAVTTALQTGPTTSAPTSSDPSELVSCATLGREHFVHKKPVLDGISDILSSLKTKNYTKARLTAQSVVNMIDLYQEESMLLDPHVPEIASPLVAVISEQVLARSVDVESCRLPCSVLFILAKVCGYRSMSASGVFPHSFNYLDPLVSVLANAGQMPWEVRFVLLLWLSVLLLLPFNLSIVLGNKTAQKANTVQTITDIAMAALADSTQSVSKAGALVLGRLLSRDVKLIDSFLAQTGVTKNCGLGVLETLNQTLKMLPSKITEQPLIDRIFADVLTADSAVLSISPGSEVRAKVLRIRIASKLVHDSAGRVETFMLKFLGDRDYLVRWAAAKGLGRVGDVKTLGLVLNSQTDVKDALLFQGRSLAVAELIVRSSSKKPGSSEFLDQEMQTAVVALACAGLEHPTTSATWQVRDAASYVIWALARSLVWTKTNIDKVFKEALLPALLTVCLFDREISCRRVAAAALQELVGRLGTQNFPPGMALIETVDFWAVADLRACFVELTEQVLTIVGSDASLSECLRGHFIDHLLKLKIVHPSDKEVRSLAAKTLTKIIVKDHANFVEAAINNTVLNPDAAVTARQGGMEFLTDAVDTWSAQVWETEALQTAARNVVPRLEKERLYRGKGGEMIRIAACRLIEALAKNVHIAFKPATSDRYLQTVLEGLRHLVSGVQVAASRALVAITASRPLSTPEIFNKLKAVLTDKSENVASRRGAVLGLAYLSPNFAETHQITEELVAILSTEALAWPTHPLGVADFIDAEARKYAVLGLVRLGASLPRYRSTAISVCQSACEDFQVDQRGDVGSWVRETAINGLACLAPVDSSSMEALLARCCERLDRIRGLAALRVHGLVNGKQLPFAEVESSSDASGVLRDVSEVQGRSSAGELLALPEATRAAVISAFADPPKDRPELSSARSAWSSCPCVFRRCCSLLSIPDLQIPLMRSLINTVGGVTAESVGEAARSELLAAQAEGVGAVKVADITVRLLQGAGEPVRVATRQERSNRFITPVMNTLAFLLRDSPGLLQSLETVVRQTVIPRVAEELRGTRDVHRLRAACALLLECVTFAEAMQLLVHQLLNSPFPSIRHMAASGLYLKLLDLDATHEAAANADEVADLLASTEWAPADSWTGEAEEWKTVLPHICTLLNLEAPTRESTPAEQAGRATRPPGKGREAPAYAELVKEEHW